MGDECLKPRRLAPKPYSSGSSAPELRTTKQFSQSQRPGGQTQVKTKRSQVKAACTACQRGKVKCDAIRPTCTRCTKKEISCNYDVEADKTRAESMRQRNDALQDEITRLRDLSTHHFSIEEVENTSLPGQPSILVDLYDSVTDTEVGLPLWPQLVTGDADKTLRSDTDIFDLQSLESSPLGVNATAWTTIGNDGIVSELLSSFFVHDNCFYMSFIDQQCFLDDMRAGDITGSDFCSPLLINAICALRCSTSVCAKNYGSSRGLNIQECFLSEARRLLDLECGLISLPTVQSLFVMYTCYAAQGKDRGGLQYRYMAHKMLSQLNSRLEANNSKLEAANETMEPRHQEAFCKVLWGLFCFESITALAYLEPSICRAPTIPRRYFMDGSVDPSIIGYSLVRSEPQPSSYVLNAMCDLSDFLRSAMTVDVTLGPQAGITLYQELRQWSNEMSPLLSVQTNTTLETCCLSQYEDLVALSLLLPLSCETHLPDGLGSPDSLCLRHCERILGSSERYWKLRTSDHYSIFSVYPLYHVAAVALRFASWPWQIDNVFERACYLLDRHTNDYPLALYLLEALKIIAVRSEFPLSAGASTLFQKLSPIPFCMADVPVAFVLQVSSKLFECTSKETGLGTFRTGIDVEELIRERSDFGLLRR